MGKLIENYSLEKEIGRGMYSTVYRAVHMKTKQEVAIKQVRA
jgi:serine/threonine protein kinase